MSQYEPAVFWNGVVSKCISSSSTLHFWPSVVFRTVVTVHREFVDMVLPLSKNLSDPCHTAKKSRERRPSSMNWITVHQSGVHNLKKLHAQVPQSWFSWTSSRRTVYHGVSRANLAHGWILSIDWWMDRRIDQPIYEQHVLSWTSSLQKKGKKGSVSSWLWSIPGTPLIPVIH